MKTVYLGLGANLGDREKMLEKAVQRLGEEVGISIEKLSPFIETEPSSPYKQPLFLNAAVQIRTILTPHELLSLCEQIELELGRDGKGVQAPRTIDIDILLYEDEIISDETLCIPHPFMHERYFVLAPLNAINPDITHPILQETVKTLLSQI